jgi:hypothetical protein
LVATSRAGQESPLALNVVFHVPGDLWKPEFAGMRTGRLSRRQHLLMVQVAIPDVPVPPRAIIYLLSLVADAIDLAEDYGKSKKVISEPLDALRQIVDDARAQAY